VVAYIHRLRNIDGEENMTRRGARNLLFAVATLAWALTIGGDARAANGSVVYTYDALGRVVTASYDTGVIVIYTYDANSNRTQQVINLNTTTLTWTATATPCTANCWGAGLW
jgi:YD repeat-containing protein